ncbi:MAG TPA: (S)-ureidoglycine aminohydrolase [Candidatus Dormibacteraeota bacterium]|nr:(S)-ureidoglycine aminohydrolase [Candidatus Dormibacteraeota bacterium]
MEELFGSTRNIVTSRYALLTPSGFVHGNLPGWQKAVCNVLISPAMGAHFAQTLITLERDGLCHGNTGSNQTFFYLLEGSASIVLDERRHRLEPGSYVYLPAGKDVQFRSGAASTRVLLFQKPYESLPSVPAPAAFVGHERDVKGLPFLGNEDARLQVLLPDQPAFDMAINIFTYQPGATLPFVETHVMEHGLMMLRGQGVYRLDSDWHPVKAGDVIWMAAYCPQWFVAIGKTPASYIYYKDVNRDPV